MFKTRTFKQKKFNLNTFVIQIGMTFNGFESSRLNEYGRILYY